MTPLFLDFCSRHNVSPGAFSAADGVVIGEKDAAPLVRRLNAIVPVSFAETDGCVAASCYPMLRDGFSAHLRAYKDALFSEMALSALDALLHPYLQDWRYRPSAFPTRYAVSCTMTADDCIPVERILPSVTVRLDGRHLTCRNLTSMKLSDCIVRGAYGCMDGNCICAVASVNRAASAAHCTEIGVECAGPYRRRGYALSCVCALSQALVVRGDTVLYQYYHTNTASAAVAERAGFRQTGKFFAYTAFHRG